MVVYVGPRCHFVQYPLRGGEMFNQVAVFESARARAGEEDWGTPDELDAAFAGMTENIQQGPAADVAGPLVAHVRPRPDHDLGLRPHRAARRRRAPAAAVHRPGRDHGHRGRLRARRAPGRDRDAGRRLASTGPSPPTRPSAPSTAAAWSATSRAWGALWHLDGDKRERRNEILRARDTRDYSFVDWLYSITALTPEQEPDMFETVPLDAPAPLPG